MVYNVKSCLIWIFETLNCHWKELFYICETSLTSFYIRLMNTYKAEHLKGVIFLYNPISCKKLLKF